MDRIRWYRWQGADLVLEVHARPNARGATAYGLHGDAVSVPIKAPANDDKANQALLRQFAEAFGVPLRQVRIERGRASRSKRLRIERPQAAPHWFADLGGAWLA